MTHREPSLELVRPPAALPSNAFLERVPREFARKHLILSQGEAPNDSHAQHSCEQSTEILAIAESTPDLAVFNVGVHLGRHVRVQTIDPVELAARIDEAYARHEASFQSSANSSADDSVDVVVLPTAVDPVAELGSMLASRDSDLLATSGKAAVTRLVDLILFDAIRRDASDIHIQPVLECVLVRYRLDGVLHTVRSLPASVAAGVTSRIKIMARLDVAEHRAPQDGRAAVTLGGSMVERGTTADLRIDLRISTLPSTYGERVVIRLLHNARSSYRLAFSSLGMPEAVERTFKEHASRSNGIILATGPTGSGKTTTLYTTLKWISSARAAHEHPVADSSSRQRSSASDVNIMTIEDPVEYDLATSSLTISQTQVDPRKNVTFATGLRHILRQDPDVIMVGEIRDADTARIAVQASLTGHLVLSTLHTNDAPSAIARLIDLEVEPFLVASSLSAVLAQRLVRRLHLACQGLGCGECFGTGYQGRVAIFELLTLNQALRDKVCERVSASVIRTMAVHAGMVTLQEAAARLVEIGVTSAAEVARVVHAGD